MSTEAAPLPEMKACPFCRGEAEPGLWAARPAVTVTCDECGAEIEEFHDGTAQSLAAAILRVREKWNRRVG